MQVGPGEVLEPLPAPFQGGVVKGVVSVVRGPAGAGGGLEDADVLVHIGPVGLPAVQLDGQDDHNNGAEIHTEGSCKDPAWYGYRRESTSDRLCRLYGRRRFRAYGGK